MLRLAGPETEGAQVCSRAASAATCDTFLAASGTEQLSPSCVESGQFSPQGDESASGSQSGSRSGSQSRRDSRSSTGCHPILWTTRHVFGYFRRAWKGVRFKDPELDEFEPNALRYKPDHIETLCKSTKFSKKEIQLMYRGFKQPAGGGHNHGYDGRRVLKSKAIDPEDVITVQEEVKHNLLPESLHKLVYLPEATCFWRLSNASETALPKLRECPSGTVNEDTFKYIYSRFFPQGDSNAYAHHVFNTFDTDHTGTINFEEFVTALSALSRGDMYDKLRWAFSLYDINGDGYITKDEMLDVVGSVYMLVGRHSSPAGDEVSTKQHVDRIFERMDINRDGVVTLDEFLELCSNDETIAQSLNLLDTCF